MDEELELDVINRVVLIVFNSVTVTELDKKLGEIEGFTVTLSPYNEPIIYLYKNRKSKIKIQYSI